MVEVLLAPVWVWLILGETASAGTFLGGGILLLAIAGNALSGLRRKRVAPPLT
jgi:drug/metabolite transporter (DMT)-like permease